MASDKISICFEALALTGNNVPSVADDGSDEWNIASVAYEAAVGSLIEAHSWKFAKAEATLVRSGDSPDEQFDDAFAKPADCLALVWVKVNGLSVDYKIIGNLICIDANGAAVTCEYVRTPDAGSWPPMFVDCVRQKTMAGIYRGLNEEIPAAERMEVQARMSLQEARTRTDQEQPKRALFISRLHLARQVPRGG